MNASIGAGPRELKGAGAGTTELPAGHTQGVRLLRELAQQGRYLFTLEEARAAGRRLGIPNSYVPQLLSRLAEGGWLLHPRRGLYAGTGSLPGLVQVHPFALATRLVEPSALGGWSALHFHGLTEQVPRSISVVTPKKVVTPSMRAGRAPTSGGHAWITGGLRCEFTTVKPERFFGVRPVWVDSTFQVPLLDPERAVLQAVADPGRFGGLAEVQALLLEHLEALDLDRLVSYGLRWGEASVAKRLGWLLEQAGADPAVLAPLAALPIAGYRPLDPSGPRRGPCNPRWRLQENWPSAERP